MIMIVIMMLIFSLTSLCLCCVCVCVVCVFDSAANSEEELSSSHKPRALTHKAHSEILRSEVRYTYTYLFLLYYFYVFLLTGVAETTGNCYI